MEGIKSTLLLTSSNSETAKHIPAHFLTSIRETLINWLRADIGFVILFVCDSSQQETLHIIQLIYL